MPLLIKGQSYFMDDLLLSNKRCCITCFTFLPDMTFTHEGNKTFVDNLVNFEKMVGFRKCKLVCFLSLLMQMCVADYSFLSFSG